MTSSVKPKRTTGDGYEKFKSMVDEFYEESQWGPTGIDWAPFDRALVATPPGPTYEAFIDLIGTVTLDVGVSLGMMRKGSRVPTVPAKLVRLLAASRLLAAPRPADEERTLTLLTQPLRNEDHRRSLMFDRLGRACRVRREIANQDPSDCDAKAFVWIQAHVLMSLLAPRAMHGTGTADLALDRVLSVDPQGEALKSETVRAFDAYIALLELFLAEPAPDRDQRSVQLALASSLACEALIEKRKDLRQAGHAAGDLDVLS